MMEHTPQVKRDEQYPLLKVEAGGGDVMRAHIPPSLTPTGWHVACIPKQSWCSRWPEFMSACWMTAILFAISFLVFYALGMSVSRRQPVVIIRCNDSKPASDVFYHHILSRNTNIQFSIFSEYLSYMAKQYPLLRFNVYFLIDDSWQNSVRDSRHIRFLNRLVPQLTGPFDTIFDQNYKREIKDFQRRYQNVNISVMFLSKYMAITPLKHKWRTIPSYYLSFYARIYAIWQNGGIGFDLVVYNNQFNRNQAVDRRVDAILKQHNDGIKSDKYADTFNTFEKEEQSEIFAMFFSFMNQILNETCSFFGTDNINPDIKVMENSPLIRTHRSKRDINNATESLINIKINNNTIVENLKEDNNISEKIPSISKMNITKDNNNTSTRNDLELIKRHEFDDLLKIPNFTNNNADMPQVVLFYEFNLDSTKNPTVKFTTKRDQHKSKYLTLSSEGHFVAASSRHHPFLAQLFSAGCQSISPKYAIKDTLLSQCSGFLRDDIYCENIHVLYNAV